MVDLVVRNGEVVDGSGAGRFRADVAIQGDRIIEVAPRIKASARQEIDATDKIVCPGFIDLHSHSDLLFTLSPPAQMDLLGGRLCQGITTELVGNCGYGPAPVSRENLGPLQQVNGFITPSGVEWIWTSFDDYLCCLERRGPLINVGALVAHGAVRVAVMGMRPDPPSRNESKEMNRLILESVNAGAFGISYGLIYPPGQFARTQELVQTAAASAAAGGFAAFHQRGSGESNCLEAVEEILQVGREGRCPVHHSHEEGVGPAAWGMVEQIIEKEERASQQGLEITMDVIPYTWVCTTMLAIYPPWALEGGVSAFLLRLRDPALRARMKKEVGNSVPIWPPWESNGWNLNLVREVGWHRILIGHVNTKGNQGVVMKNLEELAHLRGMDPFEAISDLMLEEDGIVTQLVFGISGEDANDAPLVSLLRHPERALVTDAWDIGVGSPHPGAYGAYPRVLGHYVLERNILGLEEAIRKMTSLPAARLGRTDRGLLRKGAFADLVVFDPGRIREMATRADPRRRPEGIDQVFVNGQQAVREGRLTGIHAGHVLRRGGSE